jgi:hypothetical protein
VTEKPRLSLAKTVTYREEDREKAYLAFGKAMAAWAKVEVGFYVWFEHISDIDLRQAKPIYYSATSFKSRMDLVRGAIEGHAPTSDEQIFIDQAMKLAIPYNSFRNKLAHGEFTLDGLIIEGKHVDRKQARAKAISLVELSKFTVRFNEFADLLFRARELALGFEDHDDDQASLGRYAARMSEMFKEVNREKSGR